MVRQKPLGDAELQALRALRKTGGSWNPKRAALWDNRHWTLQLLYALARSGYVAETAPDTFVMTREGSDAILPSDSQESSVH